MAIKADADENQSTERLRSPSTSPKSADRRNHAHYRLSRPPASQNTANPTTDGWNSLVSHRHIRLNQTSTRSIQTMAKSAHEFGLPKICIQTPILTHCSGCASGTLGHALYNCTASILLPVHTVETGILGTLPNTPKGDQYIIACIELKTRLTLAYLIRSRKEAKQRIPENVALI